MATVPAPALPQTVHADVTDDDRVLFENFPVSLCTLSRCSSQPISTASANATPTLPSNNGILLTSKL